MTRLIILFALIWGLPGIIYSQYYFDWGFNAGVANYLGDIGGKEKSAQPFLIDLKIGQTRWGVGGFARYKLMGNLFVRGDLNIIRIQGADSLSTNPARVGRNLSFRNDMAELLARAEYSFYKDYDVGNVGTYEINLNMYINGGVGVFYHSPAAYYQGSWHALQPLQTEGVSYSRIQPCFPVALGMYYTIKRTTRIGLELGYRFTLTDYLDDVSTTYRDTTGLSDLQKALISRPKEDVFDNLPDPNNYKYPSPRGNAKNVDGYMTAMISYSTVIKSNYRNKKFNPHKRRYKYISSKKKKRRAKAKF